MAGSFPPPGTLHAGLLPGETVICRSPSPPPPPASNRHTPRQSVMAVEPSGSLNFESAPTPQGGKGTRAGFVHWHFLLRTRRLRAGPHTPANPRCGAEPTGHGKDAFTPTPTLLQTTSPHTSQTTCPSPFPSPIRTQPQAAVTLTPRTKPAPAKPCHYPMPRDSPWWLGLAVGCGGS